MFLNTSLMEATVRLPTKSVCAPIPVFADTLLILEKLDIFINVFVPYGVALVLTALSAYHVGESPQPLRAPVSSGGVRGHFLQC